MPARAAALDMIGLGDGIAALGRGVAEGSPAVEHPQRIARQGWAGQQKAGSAGCCQYTTAYPVYLAFMQQIRLLDSRRPRPEEGRAKGV